MDATADPALLEILLSGYDAPGVGGVGGFGAQIAKAKGASVIAIGCGGSIHVSLWAPSTHC